MDRLLLTLGIIFVSLTAGYAFRHAVAAGRVRLSGEALVLARRRLQTTAVFVLIPVSAMLSQSVDLGITSVGSDNAWFYTREAPSTRRPVLTLVFAP